MIQYVRILIEPKYFTCREKAGSWSLINNQYLLNFIGMCDMCFHNSHMLMCFVTELFSQFPQVIQLKMFMNTIGRSRGGHCRHASPPPPPGSNSFVFTYIFAKKHPHQRLASPQRLGVPPNVKSWIRN